ncbi:PAS domain S-box protein [Halieaceae bacterium IMCC14734]|uniref:PAS domain S-box protein n=1 Tax=Candidatus Litorirhabdus singularis TaxID=2518993 RepID=A0ABT3TLQ6_9GAMM|nr:PAS domain S-box protein [Candidatus Litorirhabdus singularis]MCX2982939.1 PAS domain S-box protein [Candidatus Litorirhabdus singularis]
MMITSAETRDLIGDILNTCQDAVIWIDTNSHIVQWNNKAEALFGFRRESVLKHSITSTIIPDEHRVGHLKGMAKYMDTGHGNVFGVKTTINAVTWSGEEIMVTLAIDKISVSGTQYFTAQIAPFVEQNER